MAAYGAYTNGKKIRKIQGNPRARFNQKGLIVWHTTKIGVHDWLKKYGTNKQKKQFLKPKSIIYKY
jgi:hypothetical protein